MNVEEKIIKEFETLVFNKDQEIKRLKTLIKELEKLLETQNDEKKKLIKYKFLWQMTLYPWYCICTALAIRWTVYLIMILNKNY